MSRFKKWLVMVWLLIPVALLSYQFGPGQKYLAWKDASALRDEAVQQESEKHWEQALTAYGQAAGAVPSQGDDASAAALARDQLRLAQIRSAFQLGKLDDTLTDLRQFVEAASATHGPESDLACDARDFLGRVHYQAMIALRLESAKKEVWMKHWELSRQNFRFLAEHSKAARNALDRKNLEVVIKSANIPLPPTPPPPAGGGGGGAVTFAPPPPIPPPPTQGGTATQPPPDNRRLVPTLNNSELTPPEFELGS